MQTSTWSWQLWHMRLGIVRDRKIYENWVHVGVTCHNTTLSACTCFCDSQYHLPQTAGKANLLRCSLLGKIFQDHGKGCDEETGGTRHQKREAQMNRYALNLNTERAAGRLPHLPTLSEWDDFQYNKREGGLHAMNRHSSGKTADLKTWESYI